MGTKKKLAYLKQVSGTPSPSTKIIDIGVARESSIVFGFKNINLDKKPFDCSTKNADGLLYTIKLFHHFSKTSRKQVDSSFPNCHLVEKAQIKGHNLDYFVSLSPNKRLHQLGRASTKLRVIGYYETPDINLFQVCLLDLNHKLSGD